MKSSAAGSPDGEEPVLSVGALTGAFLGAGLNELDEGEIEKFRTYLELLLKWNARMNLTAIRDPSGIVERHFVECIAVAQTLPVTIKTLLDFGSGGGFPGIPIAICRPEINVALAESQNKKAAFLQEALRELALRVRVFACRAENLTEQFDCVAFRAVDAMTTAVSMGTRLVKSGGLLAIMSTSGGAAALKQAAGEAFIWPEPIVLPGSHGRILLLGHKVEGE